MTTVLDALFTLPCVTVAAIAGNAVGGGAELALSCDVRLMRPEARLHFVHTRLGIVPGWGASHRLASLIGRKRALLTLLEGRSLSSQEALDEGLADYVVDGEWPEAVMGFLGTQWAPSLAALRGAKGQILSSRNIGERSSDHMEIFSSLWGGAAHRAALERVLKKPEAP